MITKIKKDQSYVQYIQTLELGDTPANSFDYAIIHIPMRIKIYQSLVPILYLYPFSLN